MARWSFVMQVLSEAVEPLVRVNGFPVLDAASERNALMTPLTAWLVAGHNRIDASLFVPPRAPSDPEPTFELLVHRVPRVEDVWEGSRFLVYRYVEPFCGQASERLSPVLSHDFQVQDVDDHWAWERARPFELDQRSAIDGLLARLHTALADRNLDALRALSATKISDLGIALQVPREQQEASYLEDVSELMFEDDYTVDALAPNELSLVTSFGGRVVSLVKSDGRSPLRVRGAGRTLALPFVVAHLEGRWTLVR